MLGLSTQQQSRYPFFGFRGTALWAHFDAASQPPSIFIALTNSIESRAHAKAVRFCSGMTGRPLIWVAHATMRVLSRMLVGSFSDGGATVSKVTAAEPDLCFHQEIDTIEGIPLLVTPTCAPVAYPPRKATSGKGWFTWPRQRTLHLTRPRFWGTLDSDDGSCDCGQSRHSFHREVLLTQSSIFSQAVQNSRSSREPAKRLRSRCPLPASLSARSKLPDP
jgi:hypothetical protein